MGSDTRHRTAIARFATRVRSAYASSHVVLFIYILSFIRATRLLCRSRCICPRPRRRLSCVHPRANIGVPTGIRGRRAWMWGGGVGWGSRHGHVGALDTTWGPSGPARYSGAPIQFAVSGLLHASSSPHTPPSVFDSFHSSLFFFLIHATRLFFLFALHMYSSPSNNFPCFLSF